MADSLASLGLDIAGLPSSQEEDESSVSDDSGAGVPEAPESLDESSSEGEDSSGSSAHLATEDDDAEPQSDAEESEEAVEPEPAEEAPEPEPEKQPRGRAGKRIQQLTGVNRELRESLAQQEQRMALMADELQNSFAQQYQGLQTQYQARLDAQQARLDALAEQLNQARGAQEDEKLTDAERWTRDLERKAAMSAEQRAREAVLKELSPQLNELKQWKENEEKSRVASKREAEDKAAIQSLAVSTITATKGILGKTVAPEYAPKLRARMEGFILNAAAALKAPPEEAAADINAFLVDFAEAYNKSANVRLKSRLAASKKAGVRPTGAPSTSGQGVNLNAVTKAEMQAAGYKDRWEMRMDGGKRISQLRAKQAKQK